MWVGVPALLAGCALFEPINDGQAGRVAAQRIEAADPALAALAEHNREARFDASRSVMDTPARAGSGLVGEVNVGKAMGLPGTPALPGRPRGEPVKLEFNDASLKDIVTVFLHDYLKQPYSFQDSFTDRKVNLYFNATATREDLIQLFDALLENYGVKLRYSGGVYLVGSSDDKEKGKSSPLQQPSPLGIGDTVALLRLNFIDAKDFLNLAKQVAKYPEKIVALPGNALVVNSTSGDARAVKALLEDLDVPAFAGKFILVYAPRFLSAASLVAMLDSAQMQLVGNAQGAGKQFESKQIPDTERVVVVAANRAARDLVVQLLAQSDVVDANHRRVFQYPLATQTAADILPNLTTLLKAVVKSPTEVNVVADKTSNSLFIYASPEEYAEIRKLLERMDFRPPAVQIDMVIAEVTLSSEMQYGVEWFLQRTGAIDASIGTYFGPPITDAGNNLLGTAVSLVRGVDKYATLQLLGSQTSFSLLSNPKIVVRNGATAMIAVGSEQPVIKSKTLNNAAAGANTVVEPEYKKIGLEMKVTPYISAENTVRLVIKVKDTAITGNVTLSSTTDVYPVLSNRELETDLVTEDGRTIFLGGIRRQDKTDNGSKVPGLGDLGNGIGALFRNKDMKDSGQELIILATPTIILDQQGADTVTRALLRASHLELTPLRAIDGSTPLAAVAPAAPAAAARAIAAPMVSASAAAGEAAAASPAAVSPAPTMSTMPAMPAAPAAAGQGARR